MNLILSSIDILRHMDLSIIQFNTHCGVSKFRQDPVLCEQAVCPLHNRLDYIVAICPTFVYNKTYYQLAEKDLCFFIVMWEQNQVENWLTIERFCCFEGTNTLIILDDCSVSRDVKGHTSQLFSFGFSVGTAASVCGCQPSRSPASQSLSRRMWRQPYFFTLP